MVSISVLSTFFYFGCTKFDFSPELNRTNDKLNPSDFFVAKSPSKPATQKVINFLKLRNETKEFVTKFANDNGYPVWNKTLEINAPHKSNGEIYQSSFSNISGNNNDTIVYIPIVLSGQNAVNGFIKAIVNDSILVSFSLGQDYKNYPFDNSSANDGASQFSSFIMMLDHEVFGHTEFRILDKRLFNLQSSHPNNTTVKIKLNNIDSANSLNANLMSGTTSVCWVVQTAASAGGTCTCGSGGCWCWDGPTGVGCCGAQVCIDFEIGSGNEPPGWPPENTGGGSTGGTSGSGPGIPHLYPCDPSLTPVDFSLSANPLPPCPPPGSGSGFVPDPPIPPSPHNPCDTINKYSQGNNFQGMMQLLKDEVPTRKENMFIFGNTLIAGSPILHIPGKADEFKVYPDNENLFVGSWGWFHNHFADADSAGLIFSAADVNMLAEQVVRDVSYFQVDYKKYMIGVVADSNANYILMVDDIIQFRSWAAIYSNEKLVEATFQGQSLNQKYLPLSKAETEKRFLLALRFSGLKLFRGSSDFQTWTPIKLHANQNSVIISNCL